MPTWLRSSIVAMCVAAALRAAAPVPASAETSPGMEARRAIESGGEVVLVMTGVIGHGAYEQFRRSVARNDPALVVLNGPGGILEEAMLIGAEVRRRRMNTLIAPHTSCASACAIVFLSGRTKYMGDGAKVGLHSASFLDGRADAEATDIMATYLRGVGVPGSVLRRMAATAPQDIRWLTKGEQRKLSIRKFD